MHLQLIGEVHRKQSCSAASTRRKYGHHRPPFTLSRASCQQTLKDLWELGGNGALYEEVASTDPHGLQNQIVSEIPGEYNEAGAGISAYDGIKVLENAFRLWINVHNHR